MVMHSLSIIVRYHRIFCERQLESFGVNLGYPEQSVLLMLSAYDRINQDTIARHFMIDKGSITKTISKLEAKQLILRWENPENKREKLLALTETGQAMIDRMNQVQSDWEKAVFAGLSSDEMAQLDSLAGIITSNAIKALQQE